MKSRQPRSCDIGGSLVASFSGSDRQSNRQARWREAQRRELNFWRSNEVKPHSKAFWERKYRMFLAAPPLEGRVLEVGCGPSGAIGYLPGDFMRVGIDPLATAYRDHELIRRDHPVELCVATGEELPFGDEKFDVVLSFNTLDHVIDPVAAMGEMIRVAKKGGTILVWVHVLQDRWRVLRSLVSLVDRTHPHHVPLEEVHRLYEGMCSIQGCRRERPMMSPTSVKARVGNLLLESAYLTLRRF